MKKGLLSIIAMAVLMVVTTVGFAQTTYTMVASASQLEVGANYILVGYHTDGSAYAMTWQMSSGSSSNRRAINVTESNGSIVATVATNPSQQDAPFEFTLGGSVGAWTIYDPLNNGYLYAPGGGNKLNTQATVDDKAQWTITDGEDGGLVPVSNGGVEQSIMRFNYNNGTPLFSCYASAGYLPWKEEAIATITRYQKEMSGLNRQAITGHERLNEHVAVTTYADGTRVYVNYGTRDYETGGVTVPGRDYLVKRGGGQ